MSHKVVKKNDEFGVIAGILDCYMILRLQNSSYTWGNIPFMNSINGSETIEIDDAHFMNENSRPTEITSVIETKKTKLYTISKPGLFNKVLTTLFKAIFVEFMNNCKQTTTVEDITSKIVKRKNLLYKFMNDEILGSDAFSSELWISLEEINKHKLEIMIATIRSYTDTPDGATLKPLINSASRDILHEYGSALLRFIYMLSGFLVIRYNIDMKTIKADTLISTIRTLHFLGIININWNRPSNHDMKLILSNQLEVLLKEEFSHRAELQKKKDETKKSKELATAVESGDACVIETLLQGKPIRSIDSEDDSDGDKRVEEIQQKPEPIKKVSKTRNIGQPITKTDQLQKLQMVDPQMNDIPNLTNFSYVDVDNNQLQTTISTPKPQEVKHGKVAKPEPTTEIKSKKTKSSKKVEPEPVINTGDYDVDIDGLLSLEDIIEKEKDDDSLGGHVDNIDDE